MEPVKDEEDIAVSEKDPPSRFHLGLEECTVKQLYKVGFMLFRARVATFKIAYTVRKFRFNELITYMNSANVDVSWLSSRLNMKAYGHTATSISNTRGRSTVWIQETQDDQSRKDKNLRAPL